MEIPQLLLDNVVQGRAILFLGAGASKGAKDAEGKQPPDGRQLAQMLNTCFLGGRYENWDLASVSELAASEAGSLFTVQDYIRDILENFEPAEFHLKVPLFKWKAIATVNYDRIIEKAYLRQEHRLQELAVFISNDDRVEETLSSKSNALQLLKLHGCITRTHNEKLPLILTPEQFLSYQDGRDRLFIRLRDWAYECPIVFVGNSLEDSNLREMFSQLSALGSGRPRYYFVLPEIRDEVARLWERKSVTGLEGTFEDFLNALSGSISPNERALLELTSISHPIERKIKTHEPISSSCNDFITQQVDYVHADLPEEPSDPKAFYKGFDLAWFPIKKDLDVRRKLVEKLLFEVILRDEDERPTKADFYLIKAAAGAGKTVALKRLAYDAATQADVLCLYLRDYGSIEYDALSEVYRLTKERIFLFVDNAARNVLQLDDLLRQAKRDLLPLTVVTAERSNEWNVACEDRLSGFVSDEYDLNRLSEKEIEELLVLLEKHNSLGFLGELNKEQQRHQMKTVMDRQILVMLHEVTSGKPFEEILVDEFNRITPRSAQDLYLSVCALNQLGVKVRAGIISRVYSIPFSKFKQELFKPLENVIEVTKHPITKDMLYAARHNEIAQIVFERILTSRDDRFNEFAKLLRALDISFDTDRQAYRRLINHHTLKDLFPNYEDVLEIYQIASEVAPEDSYRVHQQGIYEMERHPRDLIAAYEQLKKAKELEPRNQAIIHSLSELARYRAEEALENNDDFNKSRFRSEARTLADSLMSDNRQRPYARQTLLKILEDELRELLALENPDESQVQLLIQRFEGHVEAGLQESPDDAYLLRSEAKFRELLAQKDKAVQALNKAHKANRHNSSIAIRLAKHHEAKQDYLEAEKVIDNSLEANPHDKQLHFSKAMLLKRSSPDRDESIIHHLYKSFVPGDGNYDAQFWFARYLFGSTDPDRVSRSKELFESLRNAQIPFARKKKIRDSVKDNGRCKNFSGTLVKKSEGYGFVTVDGRGDEIFAHANASVYSEWSSLSKGDRVHFSIGFSFKGPEATNIRAGEG